MRRSHQPSSTHHSRSGRRVSYEGLEALQCTTLTLELFCNHYDAYAGIFQLTIFWRVLGLLADDQSSCASECLSVEEEPCDSGTTV
jgi:hypothetical protein